MASKHWSVLIFIILIVTVFAVSQCEGDKSNEKVPLDKRFDPKTQHYAFVIPQLKDMPGVGNVSAKGCSVCHTEIYKEWEESTHASALNDIQYMAELSKKESPKWVCLNCHIPVQNQRETKVTHLQGGNVMKTVTKPNPGFDKAMQKEAISCATCHVRQDKDGESVIIGPYASKLAPHRVRPDAKANKAFLNNICMRCHNPTGEGLTENLICWFDTKKELDEAQGLLKKTTGSEQSCVSCHMPSVERRAVPHMKNLPLRQGTKHHWVGGGVPKWYSAYDKLLERGFESGLDVTVHPVKNSKPGGKLPLKITLTNARSGHYLPTGDPERFILVIASLIDKSGKVTFKKKYRIGQTWKWSPAKKIGDNRLKHGESRDWNVAIPLPASLKGVKLRVTALHVRLTKGHAEHMKKTPDVIEKYMDKAKYHVANIDKYYPFATFIYQEDIDPVTGGKKRLSPKELIELSKAERLKKMSDREY
ncbi:MAG: cytochrome c family protein [Spirochaetota bacterium]|nr:cytochrome c family protein [Spirochaetota bacterium]